MEGKMKISDSAMQNVPNLEWNSLNYNIILRLNNSYN